MKVQELRVGNLLITNNTSYRKSDVGKIACVVAIDSEKSFEELKGVATIYHIDDEFRDTYGQFMHHLSPIPLTEEWLERLGFEKQMAWTWAIEINGGRKLVYYVGEKGWSIGNKEYSDHECRYVHELQNLYFVLTGKELTLKEQ